MKIKIISRAIILEKKHILLVKNIGKDYWSLPGGHWEYKKETLRECAKREVLEETGYNVSIKDVLFNQEFESKSAKIIEFIWNAKLDGNQNICIDIKHQDIDPESEIEKIKWVNFKDIEFTPVRPIAIKDIINKKLTKRHINS